MHQNVVAFHAANGMLNKDTDLTQDCIGSLLLSGLILQSPLDFYKQT